METNNNTTVFSVEDRIATRKKAIQENQLQLPVHYNKRVVKDGKLTVVSACFFLASIPQAADYLSRIL